MKLFLYSELLHLYRFKALSLITILTIVIFFIAWLSEPRRLLNGVLFTIAAISCFIWLDNFIVLHHNLVLDHILRLIIITVAVLIFIFVAFSWVFFLWNAYFVWKYESHTLPNMLTLICGFIIIILWTLGILDPFHHMPEWLIILFTSGPVIAIYLLILMYNFLLNAVLYHFVPRFYNKDYLIVLGAGLINGNQVSPLLASRINRAITFANNQVKKGHKYPKIIMSGGQGKDESIFEAAAMKNYAIKQGVPADKILVETKSINTYQNMLFSKRVATDDFGSANFKAEFFTNNYHVFRAALLAKQVGLNANGIGAKTKLYFLPNALIREFAGVFVMHRKRHFTIITIIILLFVIHATLIGFHII